MYAARLTGFGFIALSMILFTAERISAQIIWVVQKASVAIHGSGEWPTTADSFQVYSNPAMWICLGMGIVLARCKRDTEQIKDTEQ